MCKLFYNMSFGAWLTNGWYYVSFYWKAWFTKYFKNISKNPLNKDGYTLQFGDDFDGTDVDWSKWSYHINYGDRDEKVIYKKEQLAVKDGCVVMTSDKNDIQGEPTVKCGSLYSWPSGEVLYGFFESREKLPPMGVRYWPAFWTFSSKFWPPEIDFFELMGDDSSYITMTLHWINTWTNDKQFQQVFDSMNKDFGYRPKDYYDAIDYLRQDPWSQQKQNYIDQLNSLTIHEMKGRRLKFPEKDFLSKDFHTYGCEWKEDKVVWYIDNLPVYVLDKHVPTIPMYVLISNTVSYNLPGPPPYSEMPVSYSCDYFRYYTKN